MQAPASRLPRLSWCAGPRTGPLPLARLACAPCQHPIRIRGKSTLRPWRPAVFGVFGFPGDYLTPVCDSTLTGRADRLAIRNSATDNRPRFPAGARPHVRSTYCASEDLRCRTDRLPNVPRSAPSLCRRTGCRCFQRQRRSATRIPAQDAKRPREAVSIFPGPKRMSFQVIGCRHLVTPTAFEGRRSLLRRRVLPIELPGHVVVEPGVGLEPTLRRSRPRPIETAIDGNA